MKNFLRICSIVSISLFFNSCSSNKEWQTATIIYADGYSKDASIIAKRGSYYTFIKAKSDQNYRKNEFLIPEEVKYISGKDFAYISIYFDEENYGMESWSFGKVISSDSDSIMLAETRFQLKTCACKTAGKFFHGYFLVANDVHLKIKTDNKNNIYNRLEIYEFVERYSIFQLPQEINTIQDLINSLENINN